MKKRILFTINTMGQAGAEMALIQLLKKLDQKGKYDIDLYSLIPRGELFDMVPKNVKILNPGWQDGSVHSSRGRLAIIIEIIKAFLYKFTGFRLLPYLWKNIKEQKGKGKVNFDKLFWRLLAEGKASNPREYDLAVAFIEGGAIYYLDKKVIAKKKAAFIHIDYGKAGYLPMMDQGCYDGCERIFVVSKEVGERFTAIYPEYREKVILFRNILDVDEIWTKAKKGQGFKDDFSGIRLVTVGRLAYQKAYDIAAKAFKILKTRGYPIRWYIIGEGPERGKLEEIISRLNISQDFILLGAKDNPYPYVYGADIYVHATRFEGKSIAIEEAQILEKPILASYCTGTAEQIDSGLDGLLIQLNPYNLADKLMWLIDNPDIQRQYSENVAKRQLIFPEDLDNLTAMLEEKKEVL